MLNKILVTGGAGFIGSHLVDRLMKEGFDVVVLDDFSAGRRENLSSHLGEPNFCLVEGDVRNGADVKRVSKDVDAVFHLAAIVSVDLSVKNPILVNEVNVGGTLNVLRESVRTGVKRFVYASSCAVYGEPVHLPINENHPAKPISPYGVSKLAAEHYCKVFFEVYGIETVCLRFFNVYGPRQSSGEPYSGVISQFIEQLKCGKPPVIFGDGTQTRDFVHVDDVADATLRTLNRKECVGNVINVGSGKETSIKELAGILIGLFGVQGIKPEWYVPRTGDIRRSCADLSKAERLLEYKSRFSLKKGLKKLLIEQVKHENVSEG